MSTADPPRPPTTTLRTQGKLNPQDYRFLSDLVRKRAAIVLDEGKEYLAETRLSQVAGKQGIDSLGELIERLKSRGSAELETMVIEAMTTNETSFYRDVKPFDLLRQEILPRLIEARRSERRLRMWCGAASSGQEPYSLLMLLEEHFPELAQWNLDFLATDLSEDILKKARAGTYSQFEVNRGLPAQLLVRYFEGSGGQWTIKESLRKKVRFEQMNLIDQWKPMGPLDIVFLRNVLIYFDAPTKSQILGKIRKNLRPDGVLLLGGAESTMGLDDNFQPVRACGSTYYRLIG